MVKIGESWYDANNICKMTFENERAKIYFYKDEEPLDLLATQTSFDWLVAKVSEAKFKNR